MIKTILKSIQQNKEHIEFTPDDIVAWNEYISKIKYKKDILKVEAKVRSTKDLDIIVVVADYKKKVLLLNLIEAELYVYPKLNIKTVNHSIEDCIIGVLCGNVKKLKNALNVKIYLYDEACYKELFN